MKQANHPGPEARLRRIEAWLEDNPVESVGPNRLSGRFDAKHWSGSVSPTPSTANGSATSTAAVASRST